MVVLMPQRSEDDLCMFLLTVVGWGSRDLASSNMGDLCWTSSRHCTKMDIPRSTYSSTEGAKILENEVHRSISSTIFLVLRDFGGGSTGKI